MSKTCTGCGETKAATEYHKDASKRDGLRHRCKFCAKAREKAHYEANKERVLAQKKAYREANKESIAARKKAYREANKESIAAQKKAHYEANKERVLAQKKAYREANKESIAAQQKAYYEANKESIAAQQKAHREANKESIAAQQKAYYEANKERVAARKKAHYEANKERLLAQQKAHLEANKESSPCVIYALFCVPEQRYYIGQTIYAPRRWSQHRSSFKNNKNDCGVGGEMQNDYNKHGKESFEYTILKELPADADEETRLEEEKNHILQFLAEGKSLYNTKSTPAKSVLTFYKEEN
jgi:membrane protein involved in colicin uptake